MNFISCRRYFLDKLLIAIIPALKGPVLDLGGVKKNRRGNFKIPENIQWVTLNANPNFQPDILANLPKIPVENNSYPNVVLTEVMEYIDDYKTLVTEIHRVLKTDGQFILSVPFLSPLHGDKNMDKLRFTETYLRELLNPYFEIIGIQRMGGVLSVCMDCFRSDLSAKKPGLMNKLGFKLVKIVSLIVVKLEPMLCRPSDFVTTGYWIVARKK